MCHHRALHKDSEILVVARGEIHHTVAIDMDIARQLKRCRNEATLTEIARHAPGHLSALRRSPHENTCADSFFHAHFDEEIIVISADERISQKLVGCKNQQFTDGRILIQTAVKCFNDLLGPFEYLHLRHDGVFSVERLKDGQGVTDPLHTTVRCIDCMLKMLQQCDRRLARVELRIAFVNLLNNAALTELIEDVAHGGPRDLRGKGNN